MTILFDLLAATFADPDDLETRGVFCDALVDTGRQDLAWVLRLRCPKCGGKFIKTRINPDNMLTGRYLRCRDCKEDDVEAYGTTAVFRIGRVSRELGYKFCRGPAHRSQYFGRTSRKLERNQHCELCGGTHFVPK